MTTLLLSATVPLTAASADDVRDLGTAADYGASQPATGLQAETSASGAWFVETAGTPTARGGAASTNARQADAALAEADALGVDLEVRHEFSTLWTGLSVEMSDEDAELLAQADAVTAVYPVLTFERPPTQTSDERPEMATANTMTGADIVQSELGFTGEGVRVAIIDSGTDYRHPDLGGDGEGTSFPTERVAFGYDFVGDDFNATASSENYNPVPTPDEDPLDCDGHGTHVAGITGASGDPSTDGVRGVAPDVTLGAYRVFGCEGGTTSDIIVAAMERALADGMDVVNMSIGAAFATWPQYPTAVASDNLVDAGVHVVASIGNSGAAGTWSAGAPGVGDKVIGVASYDNTDVITYAIGSVPDGARAAYVTGSPSPTPPTEGELPWSVAEGDGLACEPLTEDYSGTAVLIQRGICPFYDKAVNAQNAGAEAMVLFNNEPGTIRPDLSGAEEITIPVVSISQADGEGLVQAVESGEAVSLEWRDEPITIPNPTGGLISDFSSYGMTADLQLKPDIGAPGGSIWSTVPLELGEYASNSGTSMSAPHVAGTVALLLSARDDLNPAQVKSLLQNTAVPSLWSLNPDLELLEPVFRQGAGMVQIDDAILSETSVSPGTLSLGASDSGPVSRTLEVRNDSDAEVTYTIAAEDAIATSGNPNDPNFWLGTSTVEAPDSVTVPAGSTATVEVTISPSASLEQAQYGGYVILTPESGQTLRVPFAGFAGNYQELPLFGDLGAGLPTLATLTECDRFIGVDCVMNGSYNLAGDDTVYSMQDGDVPTMLVHLVHPVREMQLTVYAARDGQATQQFGPTAEYLHVDYLGRSGGAGAFSAWTWDGTLASTYQAGRFNQDWNVPDGDYVLEVSVLAPLGDPGNPDHRETVQSAAFTIDRNGDGNPPEEFAQQLRDVPPRMKAEIRCIVTGQGRC